MLKNIGLAIILVFFFIVGAAQSKIDSLKTALETTTDAVLQLELLDNLTEELVRISSDKQVPYLEQYMTLAKALEEYDLMASKSRFLIQYYIYKNKNAIARKLCDSLLGYKSNFTKKSSEAHLLLKRAATLYDDEELDSAIKDYDRASELFLKGNDSIFAADALFFGGQAATDANKFMQAIRKYEKASKLYEALGDDEYAILAGAELTSLYSNNGFVEKSIEERERLIKKATANRDFSSLVQLTGQNITAHYKLKDYEKMSASIDLFLQLKDSLKNSVQYKYLDVFALNYKLIHASETGNIEDAKVYLDTLLEKTQGDKVTNYLKTDVLVGKAAYYELVNDQRALIPILEDLASIKSTDRLSAQTKARDKLADIYKSKRQFEKALRLKDVNAKIKDSIYNAQKTNAFLYYQSQFEAEQKQHELIAQDAKIKQLEAEQNLATNKRNTLIAGVMSVFIIVVAFFYFRNRQKIKEQAYQNILLNNKVATKTEEINELLTETIQHIKSKERIAENLQKLSNANEGITLKSIIADLKASKADNAKLMLIKQNIEQANFEFIKKLKALHPELTKTDVEICSLIRIGLSRKEVANLRNTSMEAIKSSRFRLKKKLNLSAETSLDDYINTL
ncbi:helix-turn-helix transcriptional regulator [Winogradskyella sp.]|uniref:helix-turn-helix transcriptional regulator n=1 Tax=Winogradskyella sp. TaxID=1883156 RepID=UPI003BAAB53E